MPQMIANGWKMSRGEIATLVRERILSGGNIGIAPCDGGMTVRFAHIETNTVYEVDLTITRVKTSTR